MTNLNSSIEKFLRKMVAPFNGGLKLPRQRYKNGFVSEKSERGREAEREREKERDSGE